MGFSIGVATPVYYVTSSNYASIPGGCNYIITNSSVYSSILGGGGNVINNFQYAGVFGCNVNAMTSCALHSNNFVAQDIPPASSGNNPPLGAVSGSLYYVIVGTNRQVWVTP